MDHPSPDRPLSEEEWRALESIAFYLGRRDHSEKELRDKLSRRYPPDVIARALEAARERQWLVEPGVLAQRVSQALGRRKKSHRYIQNYLRSRELPAVPRDLDTEVEKARELLAHKFSDVEKFSFEQKQKAYKFLAYRGFENETIKKAIHDFENRSPDVY